VAISDPATAHFTAHKKPRKHKYCIQTKAHTHPQTLEAREKPRWQLVTQLLTDHNMHVSLIGTWVFPWLLVIQGVCGCACALVCMQYLCFLGFLWAVKCAVAGSLIATSVWLASRVYVCVCTQVSCSVVSNWPLCDFCGCVYCDILSIFLILQICLFFRHQTMDKVQKHNSFNTNTPS
jgi:hypothetical protein